MQYTKTGLATAAACVVFLAGCGSTQTTQSSYPVQQPVPVTQTTTTTTTSASSGYGVIQAIDSVPREQAGIGLGTVAGAVVGGVLGNQVGSGSGRTAATVAGTAGGAMVGNRMENSRPGDPIYRITVRMDNGAMQTLVQETPPNMQIGERVRLADGVIVERFR